MVVVVVAVQIMVFIQERLVALVIQVAQAGPHI